MLKDIEFETIKCNAYLWYGAIPKNSKFSNFEEYLRNPDTELKHAAGHKQAKGGRPAASNRDT